MLKTKKCFILFLATILFTAGINLRVMAEETDLTDSTGYTYHVNEDDTVTITGYTGNDTELTIPMTINDKKVAIIGPKAFYESKITSIEIPEGVTEISYEVFNHCSELSSIVIPKSVEKMGRLAFCKTDKLLSAGSLESSANIKFGWTDKIPDHAFEGSSLTSITLPDGLTEIGEYAFCDCFSLEKIDIPDSVDCIGIFAFCNSALTDVKIPDGVTIIGNHTFSRCHNLTDIVIPDSVVEIGIQAFLDCNSLSNVVLSKNLNTIDTEAFSGTAITSIVLPESATLLGDGVFSMCNRLSEVRLPNTLTYIPQNMFRACVSLHNLVIPDSVTKIESCAFINCFQLGLTVPSSVTKIDSKATVGTTDLILYGESGSAIETYAIENDYTFVALNESSASDTHEDGFYEKNGRLFWYENGVKQGVKYDENGYIDLSYRGKEIYDPESGYWYWLDSVRDGAVAVNKDVYQESLADENGTIGKWVRYDENGHMLKGWQDDSYNHQKFYFDPTFGTMAKGIVTIDGKSYEFDRVDGALIKELEVIQIIETYDENGNGWKIENGKPYWYENGVKQGVKYKDDGSFDLSYRGKEIYDPYTKAWYWLDNVEGGTIAVGKDVYQESIADNKGTIGKWVRYDSYGHMIKGWDSNENGKYLFDSIYGTMIKGWHYSYYFDEITGILREE